MKTILIGNDIMMSWFIRAKDESPYLLDDKEVSLYRTGFNGKEPVEGVSVSGNAVRWSWPGMDQKSPGTYSFLLVVNGGKEDMHSVESGDVLRLVPAGGGVLCDIPGCGGCACGVEAETLCLYGTVEVLSGEAVLSKDIRRITTLTQSEYDALEVKDGSTMYVITEDTGDAAGQR